MITVFNKRIGCTPLKTMAMKSENKGGFSVPEQINRLTPVQVIFPSEDVDIPVGATLYLRGESFRHQWATEVLTHTDGTQFVLVPLDVVMLIDYSTADFDENQGLHEDFASY